MGGYFSRIFKRTEENDISNSNPRHPLMSYIEAGYLEPEWIERGLVQDSPEKPSAGVFIIKIWEDVERQRRIMRLWNLEEDTEFTNSLNSERRWTKIFVMTIIFFVILYSLFVFLFK